MPLVYDPSVGLHKAMLLRLYGCLVYHDGTDYNNRLTLIPRYKCHHVLSSH